MWLDARFGEVMVKKFPEWEVETGFGTWYRSKEKVDVLHPFQGPITTKNWYGNEVNTNLEKQKKYLYILYIKIK